MSASPTPHATACPPAGQHTQLVQLAGRIARLNPDSATIGAGMLASLVADARRALGQQDGAAEGCADVCTAPAFTHTYRPALHPKGAHSWQRRYGEAALDGIHPLHLNVDNGRTDFNVFRDAAANKAEVEIQIITMARIHTLMTPAELREAACRLLDAAHDIEAHPAATLQRAAAEGTAA